VSGETQRSVSGWTVDTYAVHNEAMRASQLQLDSERDRRYAEVNIEKEKALKIKEEADKAALGLAREIQTYKDEKANELREQINSERGHYATKADLTAAMEKVAAELKPLMDYVAAERGRDRGVASSWGVLIGAVGLIVGLITIGTFVFITTRSTPPPQPQIIYVPSPTGAPLPSTQPQPGAPR